MLNIAEKISYVNFFLVYHLRVSNCCKNHSTDQHRLDIYNFFLSWYPKAPPLRLNFSHKPGFGRPIFHMEKNLRAMSRIRSFFGHLGWFFLHMDNSLCYVNLIQRKPRCIPPKLGIARTFFSICPKAAAEVEMPLPPQAAAAPLSPPDCRVLLLSVSGPPSSTRPSRCFHSDELLSGLLIQIAINLLLVHFLSFPPGATPPDRFLFCDPLLYSSPCSLQ